MQGQDERGGFVPFVKCSRIVRRAPPPGQAAFGLPAQGAPRSTPRPYGEVFWENLSRQPSSISPPEKHTMASVVLVHGDAHRALSHLEAPGDLPAPETLCRRRRRQGRPQRLREASVRVRAVSFHLEELRRRQQAIDKGKNLQWSSCSAPSRGPESEAEAPNLTSRPPSPTETPGPKAEPGTTTEVGNSASQRQTQLLWSPWTPHGPEQPWLPGLGPLTSSFVVTASRAAPEVQWDQKLEVE
ncbi:protein INCA1 [Ornithorhynchus anatinus]|uniref:protein INCA1 n=1 Tax=Ornithorhynchus anatinus TaxID=9258 RepID=UPI0010A82939|nr:protein INCA1 [Ornithorhynchus anatinus]